MSFLTFIYCLTFISFVCLINFTLSKAFEKEGHKVKLKMKQSKHIHWQLIVK